MSAITRGIDATSSANVLEQVRVWVSEVDIDGTEPGASVPECQR